MKKSIWSIDEKLVNLMDRMEEDENNGKDTIGIDFQGEMEKLLGQLEDSAGGVVDYIFKLQGDIAGIDAKAAAIAVCKKSKQNKIKKLENSLRFIMDKQGLMEIDTGENVIKLQKNPPSVDVTQESAIPKKYFKCSSMKMRIYDTYDMYSMDKEKNEGIIVDNVAWTFNEKLDKKAVKDDIKAGVEVDGAILASTYIVKIK
jgi:hypothetical protein